MKINFEMPWLHPYGRTLPIAVAAEEQFGAYTFLAEADVGGVRLDHFPLALFLRSLMAASPEVRGFVLDTIGKDAPMVHFGLVELSQPKGDG